MWIDTHTHGVFRRTTTTAATTTTTTFRGRLTQACPLFFKRHLLRDGPQLAARRRSVQRRKGRRLRAAWRPEQQSTAQALATFTHHSSRGQRTAKAGEGDFELNYTATIRRTPTPQTAGTQYFAMDVDEVPAVGGSRPDRVSGPQERV